MALAGVFGYMICTSRQSANASQQTKDVFTSRNDAVDRMIDDVDHPKPSPSGK
jgi:hypothetical protein